MLCFLEDPWMIHWRVKNGIIKVQPNRLQKDLDSLCVTLYTLRVKGCDVELSVLSLAAYWFHTNEMSKPEPGSWLPAWKGFCACAFLLDPHAPVYTVAALTRSSAGVHIVFAHFSCEQGLIRCIEHPQSVTAYPAYWMFGVAAIFRNVGIPPSSIKSCKWAFFLNVKIGNVRLSIKHFILKSRISILGSSTSSVFSIQ